MAELKHVSLENLSVFASEIKNKYARKADLEALQSTVEGIVSTGGEKNKIEVIKVNGSAQSINAGDRSVDIKVPVALSELTNDEDYATKTEVDTAINTKIGSAYKAAGSVGADHFNTAPSAADEGKVYNVTADFTTNANFVEGIDKSYPAGTNVVVVNDNGYKYDVLTGMVDLSDYATTTNVANSISSAINGLNMGQYAKTTEMEAYLAGELEDYATTESVTEALKPYAKTADLSGLVDNGTLSSTLAAYVKTSDFTTITESEIKALLVD